MAGKGMGTPVDEGTWQGDSRDRDGDTREQGKHLGGIKGTRRGQGTERSGLGGVAGEGTGHRGGSREGTAGRGQHSAGSPLAVPAARAGGDSGDSGAGAGGSDHVGGGAAAAAGAAGTAGTGRGTAGTGRGTAGTGRGTAGGADGRAAGAHRAPHRRPPANLRLQLLPVQQLLGELGTPLSPRVTHCPQWPHPCPCARPTVPNSDTHLSPRVTHCPHGSPSRARGCPGHPCGCPGCPQR